MLFDSTSFRIAAKMSDMEFLKGGNSNFTSDKSDMLLSFREDW